MYFWPLCPSLCLLTEAHPSYRHFPFNPLSNILAWRNARSDPPPRLAGHGVLDSSSSCLCLSWSFWPGFARSCQVLIDLFPLLNPPRPGPTFLQAAPFPRSWIAFFLHLFLDLVFYRFFLRFGLHFGSQNRPKTGKKKREKLAFEPSSVF